MVSTPNPALDQNNTSSSSNSHIGAIVGGVVGGIAALVALLLLLWFVRRRRRNNEFDGNFDPDRVTAVGGTGGAGGMRQADLLGAGATGAEVTPYSYQPQGAGAQYANGAGGGMQHIGGGGASYLGPAAAAGLGAGIGAAAYGTRNEKGGRLAPNPSEAGQSDPFAGSDSASRYSGDHSAGRRESVSTSAGPHGYAYGASPYVGGAGVLAGAGQHTSPGPSLPGTHTTSSGSPPPGVRSAKESEAFSSRSSQLLSPGPYDAGPAGSAYGYGYGGAAPLAVRNGTEPDAATDAGSVAGASGSNVIVHQDGGRVRDLPAPPVAEEPTEIPPTYDSIRSDEQPH